MDKDFKKGTQKMNNAIQDANILRYLVINSENVNSTAVKDPLGCQYIFVKPGMMDDLAGVSNIDFVQAIYAENGINLKKHNSKFGEVLYIAAADALKLNDTAKSFLGQTAPIFNDRVAKEMYARETEILNKMLFSKNRVADTERD